MAEYQRKKYYWWKKLTSKLIIDKRNQYSMIVYIFVVTVFSAVAFQVTMSMTETLMSSESSASLTVVICLLAGYFILLISVLLSVAVSNQFVGPIYHVRMHMKKIQETGSLEPVRLRKSDQFQNLAADYNELLKFIENNYTKK